MIRSEIEKREYHLSRMIGEHGNAMSEGKKSDTAADYRPLRRNILQFLNECFREFPYASVELDRISIHCRTNTKELNWNLVYLEKCGYLELGKSIQAPPYIACSATITAAGIDLVENESELNRRFPPASSPPTDV